MDGTTLIRITMAWRLSSLLAVAMLTGCTIPGMQMNTGSFEKVESKESEAEAITQLRMITPQLISEQKRQHSEASQQPGLKDDTTDAEYRVGAGDVLTVTVWDHPEL